MQISRLFEIVYLLMNKRCTTAKELSDHFEVSQRTIYRDIETLCQAGIPIYTTKGKGGGIALLDHFVLNKSVLSRQEQDEILAALSGFKATTNSESNQVINKLGALFGNKSYDWIEVDFNDWNGNELNRNKFNQMKEAILHHNVLKFLYYNSNGERSERRIAPLKLVFRSQSWYLFGYCMDKKDGRFFKVSRIRDLQVEDEVYTPNLQATAVIPELSQVPTTPRIPVVLRIDGAMGYRVYDEFPENHITKKSDGSFLIRTELVGGTWLNGYLMSYEDHIEILEPKELRDEILQKYRDAITKNLRSN
jgi:predicted DNA-binding transcriptional regulator YafY